jgi:hypothetical protein
MKIPRFDMAEHCREAIRIFADCEKPAERSAVVARWTALKKEATDAMEACDRKNEEEKADFEGILLFLCAVDDLEKHHAAKSADERQRLFTHAVRKLDSARYNFERTQLHHGIPTFPPKAPNA